MVLSLAGTAPERMRILTGRREKSQHPPVASGCRKRDGLSVHVDAPRGRVRPPARWCAGGRAR